MMKKNFMYAGINGNVVTDYHKQVRKMTFKALSAALLVGCTVIGAQSQAATAGQFDKSTGGTVDIKNNTDLATPTLNYLHSEGALIPQKKYNADLTLVDDADHPLTEYNSAYLLTPAEATGENVITKYIVREVTKYYDSQTGEEVAYDDRIVGKNYIEKAVKEAVEQNYTVSLAKTSYGAGDGVKYYQWKTEDGKRKLVETANSTEADITARYDNTNTSFRRESFTENENISANFINKGGAICNKTTTLGSITGDFISNFASSGGAIYNTGTISSITGDFISNSSSSSSSSGGAIYNYSKIGNITGNFISNSAGFNGGAIYNGATISSITGDFINNYVTNSGYGYGGAIYNYHGATIGNITGDFINNYVTNSGYGYGGAIYNYHGATIGNITGDFISNSTYSGGAIYNDGIISSITGDFISNFASYGGAIYNTGTISSITGDFISNSSSSSFGGAIYNYHGATIGNITGDFISNSTYSGGAIYNYHGATIGNITGDFISNSTYSGGAIYNDGIISSITGDFISNFASSGGAIYNTGTISSITGDFISNSSSSSSSGGAIYNDGIISSITADFISNSAKSSMGAYGGAVYLNGYSSFSNYYSTTYNNTYYTRNIKGDFINNHATAADDSYSSTKSAYGGAIYSANGTSFSQSSGSSTITVQINANVGDIVGDFVGNYADAISEKGYSTIASGGAIYNSQRAIASAKSNSSGSYSTILKVDSNNVGDIIGNFTGNYAKAKSTSGTATASGGAIYNSIGSDATVSSSGDSFCTLSINNNVGDIISNFTGNYAEATVTGGVAQAYGGAIYNYQGAKVSADNSTSYTATSYVDVNNTGDIIGDFTGNYAKAQSTSGIATAGGGAIYNIIGTDASSSGASLSVLQITNNVGDIISNFTGNYTEAIATDGGNASAYGGAIYNDFTNKITASKKSTDSNPSQVYNIYTTIANITGDFTGNYAKAQSESGNATARGGAIYNNSDLYKTIEWTTSKVYTYIVNKIGKIKGDFTNNYVEANTASGSSSYAEGGAIYNPSGVTIEKIEGDFTGNYAKVTSNTGSQYANGGAIYNTGTIGDIIGNFTNNYAYTTNNSAKGGAIYNYAYNQITKVGNIYGNFSGNYANYGGAIYNYNYERNQIAKVGSIYGNFSGNYANYGGAIYNHANGTSGLSTAIIDDIYGSFSGNHANSCGGAIYNYAVTGVGKSTAQIGDISGAFNGNYATSSGGAIYNYGGTIGDILGGFSGNYVEAVGYNARGGAIYNTSTNVGATIGDITGNIYGNYAYSTNISASGGAIFNGGKLGVIQGSIYNNYAKTDSATAQAQGGAIYTTSNITLRADNKNNYYIKDNYVQQGDNAKDYQAIWVGLSFATVTFDAINNSVIDMYDNINGVAGYGLKLTGDTSGTINFRSAGNSHLANFNNANVIAENIKLNLLYNDNEISSYSANSIVINPNATATIRLDVDFANDKVDTITAKGQTSSGLLTIKDLNVLTSTTETKKLQVLKLVDGSTLQLSLPEEVKEATYSKIYAGNVVYSESALKEEGSLTETNIYWDHEILDSYFKDVTTADSYMGYVLSLATTDTTNDSLLLTVNTVYDNYKITTVLDHRQVQDSDTLSLLNQMETPNDKAFNFKTVQDTYVATDDMGKTTDGNITINGVADDTGRSTIELGDNSGFELENKTTLVINDTKINGDNVVSVDNSDAKLVLNNSEINGEVTLNDGTLTATNGTSIETLTAVAGTVDLANDKTETLNIGTLTSEDSVSYLIDVIAAGTSTTADKLVLGADSEGVVKISEINFVGNIPSEEFEVKVIDTTSSNVTLVLAEEITKETYKPIGNVTVNYVLQDGNPTELPAILDDVSTQDIFTTWRKDGAQYGQINISENDAHSIALKVTGTDWHTHTQTGVLDTLDALLQKETENDRNFNFVDAADTYIVTVDLSNATEGTVNLNGKTDADGNHSTLNLNNHDGVTLDKATTLNVNDLKLTGNETLATVTSSDAAINLKDVYLDGDIKSTTSYKLGISGDTTLTGSVGISDAVMTDGFLTLTADRHFALSDVEIQGGTLNLINDKAQFQLAKSFDVTGDMTVLVDADLAKVTMDRLPSETKVLNGAMISVGKINLLSDATQQKTYIPFAYDDFKENVQYTGEKELQYTGKNIIAYAPIYKYSVSYNIEDGQFLFARGDVGLGGKAGYEAFNPSVLSSPVAAASGAKATMNQTFNYAFQNSADFMNIPYLDRISKIKSHQYALSPTGDATDVGTFSPLFMQDEGKSIWIKTYATFENVPLKNGPKVSNNTYGTLVGFDTPLEELKHGWARTYTAYIGYNGASQRYNGISSYLNGGLIGGTLSLYKKNFFNATTISAGSMVGENQNMYGNDNYTMLLSGIGNKTGYNLEYKNGKYIVQPNLLLSYTFVNTFDYTNAAGVRIETKPLHAIQVSPGVKFIGNFKNGWQPYLGVNMVWNLMGKSHATANGVALPEMSIKPYVQYGLGLQKHMKDHFMAYGQAMIQNGGRNGISLTAGFRWALGHDCQYDNVQKVNKDKVVKIKTTETKAKNVQCNTQDVQCNNQVKQSEKNVLRQLNYPM